MKNLRVAVLSPLVLLVSSRTDVCVDEFNAITTCIDTLTSARQISECTLCIGALDKQILNFTHCTSLNNHFCEGTWDCNCGTCNDETTQYTLCAINASIDGGCEVSCHPSVQPPSPSLTSTTTSTSDAAFAILSPWTPVPRLSLVLIGMWLLSQP